MSKADALEVIAQGQRLTGEDVDAFMLSVNNVYRIVYQQREDLKEAHRLLRMAVDASNKSEPIDVGQVTQFLERKW